MPAGDPQGPLRVALDEADVLPPELGGRRRRRLLPDIQGPEAPRERARPPGRRPPSFLVPAEAGVGDPLLLLLQEILRCR